MTPPPNISDPNADQDPTPEQTAIIEALVGGGTIVLAGPGTGKTFTLIGRVDRILRVGKQPLLLSFTRSVVRELHQRTRAYGSADSRYLRPVTFDSFATRMLSGLPQLAGSWENAGYDGRIEAATAALSEDDAAAEWVRARFDHVVVDEVQDLVGCRARMVLALLELLPGFTLFGDPAQGIYGWQEGAADLSADDFLRAAQSIPGRHIERFDLTFNHRARNDTVRGLASFRPVLIDPDEASSAHGELRGVLLESEPLGELQRASDLVSILRGRTAILCRTNVEALKVSESLWSSGVDHVVRRAATDRAVVPWLAEVVRGRRGALGRRGFLAAYGDAALTDGLDAADAWELLAQTVRSDDRIPLDRLADAVRSGRLPDELQETASADVVVSTVHRAKGLEFDNVVVVVPGDWRTDADVAEEARVLFVAMTRTCESLMHVRQLDTRGWRQDPAIDRWYRCRGNQTWQTLGIEIKGDDIHKMHPAGTHLFTEAPVAVQDRLRDQVRRGDPVELELVLPEDGDEPKAWYVVRHQAGPIGVTGERFGRELARRLRQQRNKTNRWPPAISGLRVEGLDSVAGLEGVGSAAGLGSAGIWLRVRIVGLGNVNWTEEGSGR